MNLHYYGCQGWHVGMGAAPWNNVGLLAVSSACSHGNPYLDLAGSPLWGARRVRERGWGPSCWWVIFNPVWDQLTRAGERRAAKVWAPAPPPPLSCQGESDVSAFVLTVFVSKRSALQLQGSNCPQDPNSFPYVTSFSRIWGKLDTFPSPPFFLH